MENDGFKLVKRRKQKRLTVKSTDINYFKTALQLGNIQITNKECLVKQIEVCVSQLKLKYISIFQSTMVDVLSRLHNSPNIIPSYFKEIVCFGLGNFTEDRCSLYQLALLMYLRDELKYPSNIVIYDPCFNKLEKEILRLEPFKFKLLEQNTECNYQVQSEKTPTLFYMPHMYIQHYHNVLKSNCDRLTDIVIFGNSFTDNHEKNKIEIYTKELIESQVENEFELYDIFYGQSIHAFKKT